MELTVKDGIFYCGDKPMPCDDPALSGCERKYLTIIGINHQARQIVVSSGEPLAGKKILFIEMGIYREGEKQYTYSPFAQRFEARIADNAHSANEKRALTYLWTNPQEYFLDDYHIGHILTFVEL